jgi:peptidyl-prolyl cis-trans isomerase C
MRKSRCPSRHRGGDLGAFRQGEMVAEFYAAVFSGELNKLVGPVKTEFGYYLIEVPSTW